MLIHPEWKWPVCLKCGRDAAVVSTDPDPTSYHVLFSVTCPGECEPKPKMAKVSRLELMERRGPIDVAERMRTAR